MFALKLHKLSFNFVIKTMFNFSSSAIENITTDENRVTVTFNGGRDYTYTVNDVATFVSSLSRVIESGESVGRFVNTAIRNETLMPITAWGIFRGVSDTNSLAPIRVT